ncbi:MAG: type II toxin-antitoxin system HicA family toxin [Candidatus Eremiobacteraeota bacterium]|nr:type II toxin-antitoxin system HicA family toxin [Candidatus Eremiobacteraeota bacterium]
MNYRQIEKLLRNNGWVRVRSKGSHRHFRHPSKQGTITVPYHGGGARISPGTVLSILKQAGLR